ncbi:RHS repeat-associated core domain-containing protein [Micrococcaceae bacterium Sec5.7]
MGTAAAACAAPPVGASTYTYDANGNTTRGGTPTSTWNTFDQLASHTAGSTTSFAYAGPSNTERTAAGATSYLNGSLGITQQTTAGASTSFIRDPAGTLISMRNSAGASFYYTTDALGSVIALTDSTQAKAATYTYDSWGNTTQTGTQAAANPWRYAGGYKDDPTGLTKFGARYYAPGNGRFTQPDPSGQEGNRYLYAGASPCNFTDPTGLSACSGLTAAAAGIGVFAAGLFGFSLFVDSSVIGLPAGLSLGVLSGVAAAFGALTAGAAFVACQ